MSDEISREQKQEEEREGEYMQHTSVTHARSYAEPYTERDRRGRDKACGRVSFLEERGRGGDLKSVQQ